MREIQLTKGYRTRVDDQDYEMISAVRWHVKELPKPYAYNGNLAMHRLLCGLKKGDKKVVDHIDGDSLNNQRDNLRVVDQSLNCFNRLKNKRSANKYRNVNRVGKRFMVRFMKDGRWVYLGYFGNEEVAHRVLEEERQKLNC